MKTYFANPKEGFVQNRKAISKALSSVIDSGIYVLGKNVLSFENEFNDYLSKKGFFVSCASGTDAITLALLANNCTNGSKIIVPSHTAPASIIGILNAGCVPIYIDINTNDLLLEIKDIEKIVTKYNIKAILAVHLYGNGINIKTLKKTLKGKDIKIIEDCAQSTGTLIGDRHAGTLSNAGCFSFFPTKNLSALGDGGGIWVPTKQLKDKLLSLRQYGWDANRNVKSHGGINSRLDELQAAILRIKLKKLNVEINKRRKIAKIYDLELNDTFKKTNGSDQQKSSYHLYVVRTKQRKKLMAYMEKKGIILGIHYHPPNHQNGLLSKYSKGKLPVTEEASKEVISLPIYPGLDKKLQLQIIKYLNEFK